MLQSAQIYNTVREEKIIAIVRGVPPTTIIDIAKALHAGGIRLMEITCNTPGVEEMISEVYSTLKDDIIIGAGTVITRELAEKVRNAGAQYIIAPDVNPEVIRYCMDNDIAVIPGAATPTEILNAYRMGVRMIKIFPAQGLGIDYIKQLRGPVSDMDFIAVGGINPDNLSDFLDAGCIGVGLSNSLIKKELVANSDWQGLTALVSKIKALLK